MNVKREPWSKAEKLSLMDIRMLVQQMQTDSSPWNLIEFVGSPEAVQLAKECQDAANSKAAALATRLLFCKRLATGERCEVPGCGAAVRSTSAVPLTT